MATVSSKCRVRWAPSSTTSAARTPKPDAMIAPMYSCATVSRLGLGNGSVTDLDRKGKTEGAPQRDALGGSFVSPTYVPRRAPARGGQAWWRSRRGGRGEPSSPVLGFGSGSAPLHRRAERLDEH